MVNKEDFLKMSISKFTRFGSKRFSMDDLAAELGISKKTIYQYFSNKEELISESLLYFLENVKTEVRKAEEREKENPLQCVIEYYKIGLKEMRAFNPSFLFGLKKYYPTAYKGFEDFRKEIVYGRIYFLLKKAREMGQIRENVNLELICELYFLRMDEIVYSKTNLFENYDNKDLLEHLIVNNILGILTPEYYQKARFVV